MKRPENNELVLKAVKGELPPAENARLEELLAGDAQLRSFHAEEAALEEALGLLPDVPVSSNFTARVLQAARIEESQPGQGFRWGWLRSTWRPAAVMAGVMLAVGGIFYQQRQHQESREELAGSLAVFSDVAATLSSTGARPAPAEGEVRPVNLLQDFEAIQQLAHMPAEQEMDMELFAALQR